MSIQKMQRGAFIAALGSAAAWPAACDCKGTERAWASHHL